MYILRVYASNTYAKVIACNTTYKIMKPDTIDTPAVRAKGLLEHEHTLADRVFAQLPLPQKVRQR